VQCLQVLAIKVLLEHVRDLDRAHEYASKVRSSCSALLALPDTCDPAA
jgi:hypothetical protein